MRITYHELIGKRVVTADGQDIGRLADLDAEADGDKLRVVKLFVGPGALLQRIAFKVGSSRAIPWDAVARIDKRVELKLRRDELGEVENRYG